MRVRLTLELTAIAFGHCCVGVTMAINPTAASAPTGKTPLELAEMVTDEGTGLTVDPASVTTVVNDADDNFPASDTDSYGHFMEGVTTPGTELPGINGGGPNVVYAGGLDIDNGVCLCTGRMTDGVEEPERGIGLEGPNNGASVDNTAFHAGEISEIVFAPTG